MSQEQTPEASKKNGKSKVMLLLILTLVMAGFAVVGFLFVWQNAGYLTTDNASVDTTLIFVSSSTPGRLERFTAYEGRYVQEGEVLGWVEQGEALRSPFYGLVVQANAVQDQLVTPMDVLAIIADVNDIHIRANIEETDIARIHLGQEAVITIDVFGNRQFAGYVAEIGSVTQAALDGTAMFFNTGGTFTRVTHLLPVRINLLEEVALDSFIGVNARVRLPVSR